MMNVRDKTVLVLGLGASGLSMARYLARDNARLRLADTRDDDARRARLLQQYPEAECAVGAFTPALLDGVDLVAVSPGLAPEKSLAEILPAARAQGIAVVGDIELFAWGLAELRETRDYQPKVLGITGTNGKTTVTRLTTLLCERAGLRARAAGNIGPAALDALCDALDDETLPDVWVLELSSFQLYWTNSLHCAAATILNLSEDHLDWHLSQNDYLQAKLKIFATQAIGVLNRDDAVLAPLCAEGGIGFGSDAPVAAGDFGLIIERDVDWLAYAEPAPEAIATLRRKSVEASPPLVKRLMPTDALRIHGRHNALNVLAALGLCTAIGLPMAPLLHGLRDYTGEPHRVELIATVVGVRFYDDSKGTNVGATAAALLGLAPSGPARLLLIAGGDGKGQNFAPLAQAVAGRVRTIYLIGRDGPAIGAALRETGVEQVACATLEDAVAQAAAHAREGDAVLLSPACASWDMFRDYAHRAEVFGDAVREWALAHSEALS